MRKLNRKTIIISIIIIFIIAIYYLFIREKDYFENNPSENILNTNEEKNEEIENKISDTDDNKKIIIYVAGAIKNEGIYELDENSRIADCIEMAGGLADDANIKDINLAYVLEDGMKVYIPKNSDKNEVKDETSTYVSKENGNSNKNTNSFQSTNVKNKKININTATQTELETLPGIGPSTATKIINYRKENGKFNSIEDIKKVSGIGDSKYSQIKDLITN